MRDSGFGMRDAGSRGGAKENTDTRLYMVQLTATTTPMVRAWNELWGLFKDAASCWWDDKAPRFGAALAYYAVFSLPATLIIVTAIAGVIFGREAVENRLFTEIASVVGVTTAEAIQNVILSIHTSGKTLVATVIGIAMLLLAALGVFVELQDALNTIWRVKPRAGWQITMILRERWISFSLLLSIGFLLLVSMVISTAIATFSEHLTLPYLVSWLDTILSFSIVAALFALIFRILPDVRIPWSVVWIGALVTSVLFTAGKLLISWYVGKSGIASVWGAAASVVVVLVWIYYSSQIVFFGAEFMRAYMERQGNTKRI